MTTAPSHSEKELVLQLQAGSNEAFTQLYDRYYERVLFFARRYVPEQDAQDVVAETFLQLWRKHSGFTEIAPMVSFLFTITRNRCYDWLRRQNVQQQYAARLTALNEATADDFFTEQVRVELIKLLEQQIALLPEKMQQVFLLSYRDGLKPAKIAELLGISVKTVSNQKLNAVSLLRNALKDHSLEAVLLLLIQL